jgi:transglutaminase-like putative cysteine protease
MAADSVPRSLRVVTFVMVAAAVVATEGGAAAGRSLTPPAFALAGIPLALAAVGARFAPRPTGRRTRPPTWAAAVLLALAAVPFAVSPALDRYDQGRPLEVQMLTGFGYVALGLAALGAFPACLRLAVVSALFLMLFSLSLGDNRVSLACLGVFAAAGVVWLFLGYRAGLRAALADAPAVAAPAGPTASPGRTLPWAAVALVALLVAASGAVVAVGPKAVGATLWELVPSSGGTGRFDRNARGGVNDGNEETAGKNPAATGMVDTDQFLESPLPSLYDAISDMYGKPHKKTDQERTQALSATAKEQHGRTADGLRPSPTFPTSRNAATHPRSPLTRAARALFEVQGPTPLHVRAAVFEHFDGRVWVEAAPRVPLPPHREGNTSWMTPPHPAPRDVFAPDAVRHSVKVAKLGAGETVRAGTTTAALDGTLMPSPPHLSRFKLGKVEQESFFACGADGLLRIAGRKLPGGVAVESESRVQDPRKLFALPGDVWSVREFAAPATRHADELADLARSWVGDAPHGWPQIDAVVRRLRAEFIVDDAAGVPPDHPDVVAFFLLESRRGPDYMFATSAAVLLRHLGYRTRLVAGFYAAPQMYDRETRHTPVGWEHVHVWPEVQLAGNTWIVLEPTPGYAVLGPPTPWREALASWVAERATGLGFVAAGLVAVVWWRRSLVDASAVAWWRARSGPEWRGWVIGAARLVERRAAWSGRPRPVGQTAARYFAHLPESEPLAELVALAEWARYAPAGVTVTDAEVWAACDRAVRAWTYRRFRRVRGAG